MTSATSLIQQITRTVDYLRISINPPPADWIRCEPLVADPHELADLVRGTREGRGTDRDDVAMSLFVQGYAFRIASLSIGAWVMGDTVIDVAPAGVSVALGRHRPNAVALDEARIVTGASTLATLHDSLIDGHLALLVANAHAACRVGEPLLWGNVAASCAASFGAFAMALGERGTDIRDRAQAFFDAARPEVSSAGHIVRIGDRWVWERKSCCLWYLTESAFKCEDCSLWNDDQRRARYAAVAAEVRP